MELFIQHVPVAATSRHIEDTFYRPLAQHRITHFHAEKLGQQPLAKITILDVEKGREFLKDFGTPRKINWAGKWLRISRSHTVPSRLALRFLKETSGNAVSTTQQVAQRHAPRTTTRFDGGQLECGKWDYVNGQLTFISHFKDYRNGSITIGRKQAIFLLGLGGSEPYRIDINYHDCEDIVLGEASIIFNQRSSPKIYKINDDQDIVASMQNLGLRSEIHCPTRLKKIRVPAMTTLHATVTGACWSYRFSLVDQEDLSTVHGLLDDNVRMCPVLHFDASVQQSPVRPFAAEFNRLQHELTMDQRFGSKPFALRFQLDRLARNGYLPPQTVTLLLPKVSELLGRYSLQPVLSAIRRFTREMPFAGPLTESEEFSLHNLEKKLELHCTSYNENDTHNAYELSNRHFHVNLVYKIVITPSGVRLEGPEAEPTNRVLRSYKANTDSFVRVECRDDDGAPIRYDPVTDLSCIYQGFKEVFDSSVYVCGFAFSFLGFSHSSLRSQSCWFMHPFFDNNTRELLHAERLLKRLGNFESIRTPAKCAARIGQNFTDTNPSVDLHPSEIFDLPLVTRNGRDFGDGVGTISLELLRMIHRVYGSKRLLKPTVLQIRFQGAKGMVALDTTLTGIKLCLRSNMIKFPIGTQPTWNLEICGAGFRPLPMVLNRQFIKLFEDLNIPIKVFMDLQNRFKEKLTKMTDSPAHTAKFMEDTESPSATKLPSLIRYLVQVGLDYHADEFLSSVVDLAVVSKLREVKYKGRIPIEEGVTLYGIMDETGFLKEREIYVVTENPPQGGKNVLVRKNVVVTRSPAMHPGDIQIVDAVDVPEDSPLTHLRNVVVFSQHGERDIPSMLSGGDLDGDLYNVIWHQPLIPRGGYHAADYPKVAPMELDRVVTRKDMSDFFVKFMETDKLGMICTAHMIIADQREAGSLEPACIELCEMASTAVDFSKTGIAMTKKIPFYDKFRPDFMAPSPRVFVSAGGFLDLEDKEEVEDDAFVGIDSDKPRIRYYTSHKALGQLFRNIDERKFVAKMQQRRRGASNLREAGSKTLMRSVLDYAKHWARQYGVIYVHHKPFARQIRRDYDESLVTILHDYEPTPRSPVSEIEAFAGHLVGRQGGPQDNPLKELAKAMRERFNTIVDYAAMRITKGDEAMREAVDLDDLYETNYVEREIEALPRALACLEVVVTESKVDEKLGELKSFGYVALGLLLRELDRYRVTTFGSRSGLPRMGT